MIFKFDGTFWIDRGGWNFISIHLGHGFFLYPSGTIVDLGEGYIETMSEL